MSALIVNDLQDLRTRATAGKRTLPRNLTATPVIDDGDEIIITGLVLIGGYCVVTHKLYVAPEVKANDLADYLAMRKYARDAFPYLSPEDREFIISGTSPEGWKRLFALDSLS